MMPAKRATGSLCTELGGLLSMLVRLAIRRWREIVVLLLLASFIIPPAWAEDDASSHITRLENRDFDGINFKGVTEFEISDPDLMPRQLAQAATALHCSYADGIKTRPTRFIRINNSAFALVFCPALLGTDRIFDIQNPRKPILMQVAFFAVDSGFGTTSGPGIVTWKKGTDIFEAVIGSDLCPSSRLRHVYRFGSIASGQMRGVAAMASGWFSRV
jgi:hypothetical protein